VKRQIIRDDESFAQVMALVVRAIADETDAKLAGLESKLERFEAELAEFCYKGQWVEGTQYRRGNFVSLGAIWHANYDTQSRPGADNTDWTLAVPKGRDGKDGAPPEQRAVRTAARGSQNTLVTRR
jgi:hypothetical protein